MKDRTIRLVRPDANDAARILAIYAPFVRDTTVTFEYDVPSVAEFTRRIETIASMYPYLVSESEGRITAYAYASRHMERAAYSWDVQTSVYAAPEARGTGMAKALYACLFGFLAELGYCNAYAVITQPNPRSMRFHESFGFTPAGVHHASGYKLGAWHDVAWMEKRIAEHPGKLSLPRPVSGLDAAFCDHMFTACLR